MKLIFLSVENLYIVFLFIVYSAISSEILESVRHFKARHIHSLYPNVSHCPFLDSLTMYISFVNMVNEKKSAYPYTSVS